MNKLPALPLDLDNSPARMSIHIKAGELVTVMHQWGHAVYAAGQQASTEDVVAWQNRHAPDHIVEGKYAPDASDKWVPLGYVLTRQATPEAPTAATDQPSAEQVDERARFDACAIAAGFDVSRDTYGEYHSVDLRRYWSGWQWHASLTPTAPQAASQHARDSIDHDPEFQRLAEAWRAEPYGTRGFLKAWDAMIAHIDRHAPQAATPASEPDIFDAVRDYRDRHPEVAPQAPYRDVLEMIENTGMDARQCMDAAQRALDSTPAAPDAPLSNAEFLAKRLGRVAKLAGVTMPGVTYEQIAEVAGTILGEIARALENDDRLAALLPGPYYMDPPDGGSVSVMEQLARMAQDAAPRDVSLSMTVPVTDIPPDQTIEQRIDMLCDVAMTTHTAGDTLDR